MWCSRISTLSDLFHVDVGCRILIVHEYAHRVPDAFGLSGLKFRLEPFNVRDAEIRCPEESKDSAAGF